MASVKISQLNPSSNLNANPAFSVFPTTDIGTGDTTKISAKDLGDTLYSNNTLIVGEGGYILPNLVAQFTGVGPSYVQVNIQNLNANGSADFIMTADDGDDVSYYVDLGINNSEFDDSEFSSMAAHDGYLYVHGDGDPAVGNLVIGTATSGANILFITGGTVSENIKARIANSGLSLVNGSVITFNDGTVQSTASAPNSYSTSAYSFANNVNVYAYSAYAFANTVNTSLNSANTFLQANDAVTLNISLNYTNTANSFLRSNDNVTLSSAKSYTDVANTFLQANDAITLNVSLSYTNVANNYIQSRYLANTTGTFGGTLTIAGSANISSYLTVSNSTYDYTNTALVKIVGTSVYQTPTGAGYMLHVSGVDGAPSRIVNDSYGTSSFALFGGRKANGTAASPTAVANNNVISRFASSGYNGSSFVVGGQSRIDFVASEDYSVANTGTRIEFWNTPNQSNTITKIATFNATSAEFLGVLNPQKGFIYTPNVISDITNTLTIDIANTSLYKFDCDATTTISLTGYQYGKVVEVWVKNVDNNNHTVTHGCQANNSTVGSVSFSLTAGKSAYLRYFSIDGDNANTYVSINYS